MSIRSLRARLGRLEGRAGAGCVGEDRDRCRRREKLVYPGLQRGLAAGETAEKPVPDSYLEKDDREGRRRFNLLIRSYLRPLTEEEQTEYAELLKRTPPNPNPQFRRTAELFAAAARKRPHRVGTGHQTGGPIAYGIQSDA